LKLRRALLDASEVAGDEQLIADLFLAHVFRKPINRRNTVMARSPTSSSAFNPQSRKRRRLIETFQQVLSFEILWLALLELPLDNNNEIHVPGERKVFRSPK
jgi:hypothetical protein